jgi:8-oxo-dGTP pyrophosphatase MutT (NUDIX family)
MEVPMKEIFENFKKAKDNRNGNVVTFDFDHTIVKSFMNKSEGGEEEYQYGGVNKEIIKRIKSFKQSGKTTFIVTSRQKHLEDDESSVKSLLNRLKIEVDGVFYTNGEPKAQKLYELGSTLHYDDDPSEHEAIEAYKNLHKDFKIMVKYPDDLLEDIEAVAKGVIITADGKILIAERSDSYEWDAPGGHIMQGEEANYSFWREVKEELGLEVNGVQFLDKTQTTWQGVTKDTFYFIGRTDYIMDELEGILNLQWEISDWFCGDFEEIQQKTKGNQTQHLENVMNLLYSQQELLESRQPHSKNHKIKKRRIIGLGGSKTTGAKGLERVKDFNRSKSAPPGFGVLEEENDEKDPKTYKIKIKSTVEEKKGRKKRKKKKKYSVHDGKYYDFSFLDSNSDSDDDGGGE